MMLWLLFAILTACVLVAVMGPLVRPAGSRSPSADAALEVYRHQLREVERERERGLIEAGEAEAAKLEISRRLLAQPSAADGLRGRSESQNSRGPVALAAALLVPLVAVGLYLAYGSPGLPGFPASARSQSSADSAGLGVLIAKVEARLREHPEDGDGWEVIAPVYLKLERFRDAANAYTRAAQLKGENIKLLAGFAEASVLAADGVVTEEARLAYEKIHKLEPARFEPRFWLALAKEQDGKLAEARADYQALLADAPGDAPWRAAVNQRLAEVSRKLTGGDKAEPAGPTPDDMAPAQRLTPEQRTQMISGMVDGLAERLKSNGKDLAGWLRLINAYSVLNRKGAAQTALSEARKQLDGDAHALQELSTLATRLGLGS